MDGKRYLIVTADDFGIGPATSQGILDLAVAGRITCAVLLVNSPHAGQAVHAWRRAGRPMELGWHPCLTLDRPLSPIHCVPSLVGADGRFRRLGDLARRMLLGRIPREEVETELRAQYEHFFERVGQWPTIVNAHHHVQIFSPVDAALTQLLARQRPLPYVRRVRESWRTLACVRGARGKRCFLTVTGRRNARRLDDRGFPGNDWLVGVADPPSLVHADSLVRWLRRVPGRVVELTCHPGFLDLTLLHRDAEPGDGQLQRRVCEYSLLKDPRFHDAGREAGFTLISPSELIRRVSTGDKHAA